MTSYHIERNTKYDRQIRLWAQDGQSRLENTHVCLINANPAGAETLKNLVLPGVGSFTIVDDAVVSADDLSGNFFLEQKHLGEGIASSMAECLQELNPDVKGAHIDSSLEDLLVHSEVWGKFSIVVISGHVRAESLQKLTNILWDRNIPLLVVVNTGFYASLAVLARETTVVETHDPSKTYDLRIDCPWPELSDYSSAFDLLQLDDTEHAHVPYIVIFIQALEKWRTDHGGYLPQNYAEKREFRSGYIEKMARNINVETNFIEASRSVHRALQVTRIPNSIQDLLSRSEISDQCLGSETPEFWLYVRALKSFVHKNGGKLPLPGNIPDMASTTTNYVQLQNIYRNKADADKDSFIAELVKVYQNAGRDVADICPESVSAFCKNAAFLFVTNGSKSLYSESLVQQLHAHHGVNGGGEEASRDLVIYFGMLALRQVAEQGKNGELEAFMTCFEEISSIPKTDFTQVITNTLKEIFTHDSTSYHNTCSFIGGIAGQEALKIATAQYIPLDNLYIYDGIRSTSSKWRI